MNRAEENTEENVEELNRMAMAQLTSEKYNHAINYLNQALFKVRLMPESVKKHTLAALTYNNLGVFYKRTGQADHALDYFFQSLEMEKRGAGSVEGIANTNLNISVMLSLKNEHERALRYAIKALMLLKKEYANCPMLIVSIVNCYFRIGIEYRALQQLSPALQCFKKGYELAARMNSATGRTLKKNFKRLYVDCVGALGEKRGERVTAKPHSRGHNQNVSSTPRSTLDSYTTVLSYKTANKPSTPRTVEKPQTGQGRRGSLVLPPMEEFNVSKKSHLGSIYEIEEKENKRKKLNSNKHRAQEKLAASVIQAWWRGYRDRKKYHQILLSNKIKEAEEKARKAIEEVRQLKTIAQTGKLLKIIKKK
jgi:tetratricopeptide (TPR) repeat protein